MRSAGCDEQRHRVLGHGVPSQCDYPYRDANTDSSLQLAYVPTLVTPESTGGNTTRQRALKPPPAPANCLIAAPARGRSGLIWPADWPGATRAPPAQNGDLSPRDAAGCLASPGRCVCRSKVRGHWRGRIEITTQ